VIKPYPRNLYTDQDITELARKISDSKKYKNIYEKTVRRIVEQCLGKYGKKQAEKKARTVLHQIWGAYYSNRADFAHLLTRFKNNTENWADIKDSILDILSAQSSTQERIPILDSFYREIFSVTGYPSSIIDHACGLNPLTIYWMNLHQGTKYYAFDIDKGQTDFLRSVFELLDMKVIVEINNGDILTDEFCYADVVFMLKLLPPLEQQSKGSGITVMRQQQCRYMVISFPVRSLSGNEKGMAQFYSDWFENLIKNEQWQCTKILFETELVFAVRK